MLSPFRHGLHLRRITPDGGNGAGKARRPVTFAVLYFWLQSHPQLGRPHRVLTKGCMIVALAGCVADFAAIVRWSYSGFPSPVSTIAELSALLFWPANLGTLGLPRKPVFTGWNLF
jgi:hypothetical protein